MSRYIDSETLKAEFTGNFQEMWHWTGIRATIDVAPPIDAVPVSELIKLRDTLYKADAITMAGLFQLNMLISENSRE